MDEFQQKWPCLRKEGFDDLLQECLTHWFLARGEYEPTREASKQTFMGRVIRHKLTDLVRERETDKRKATYLTVSLDEPLGDDEETRQKEEKAIANKRKAKRRGRVSPSEIAAQIYQEIVEKHDYLLLQYDLNFLDKSKPFDTFELPAEGVAKAYSDMFHDYGVRFTKGGRKHVAFIETKIPAQDNLVVIVAESGTLGLVRIPHETDECRRVFRSYSKFVRERGKRLSELIAERTADEDMQEKIYEALISLILRRERE